MKAKTGRRIRHHFSVHENSHDRKEDHGEHTFFSGSTHQPFFKPHSNFGCGQVVSQACEAAGAENENEKISRMEEKQEEREEGTTPTFYEQGIVEQNTRHYANCNGVSVEGRTDANYRNYFRARGSSSRGSNCVGCTDAGCVTNTGIITSVFMANPRITLPPVPSGLNKCEQRAVRTFINTTLRAHERQHVAAFNTYRGRVRTRYTYHGCLDGLNAHAQQIHDNIESARRARSDAASAALDANGANIFHITCDCPDPETDNGG